ncbi:BTB/POZ domain-containing protein NPY2 [Tanacetum coccineum]|uniref:BTB/POZ domain-containing protein NPY2 n=1 Tax=Tanacetum coccineum TaxID=301880 RepID=A0ABQ5I1U0_9ASTR
MDEVFKDQNLALIMLGSLLEEYNLLEITLLNGKDDVSLSEVCNALYSKDLIRKDKKISSSRDAENADRITVTLKGVRYSPKLKKNIISVGTLESKGFEVRAKDGVIKIISGVLVVMKGIRKINNTYHYKGRTFVGTIAVVMRYFTFGRHLEELYVTWAHLEKNEQDYGPTPTSLKIMFSAAGGRHRFNVTASQRRPRRHHKISRRRQSTRPSPLSRIFSFMTASRLKRDVVTAIFLYIQSEFRVIFDEKKLGGRKAHLLEDKQIPSVGVFDEVYFIFGRHLEELHVTWAHLEKKRTRLRTYTNISQDNVITNGDRNSKAAKLWHIRLGHAGEKSLYLLIKQGLLKGLSSFKLDLYENCINKKTTMVKFGTTIHKTQVCVYALKTNDEVLGVFIKCKKMTETQTCRKIKHLRTDNGEEYKNDLFTKFCEDEGIVKHFTVIHTPEQNGMAEHMNQTLLEKVWCMLSNAGLDYDSLHVFGSATYYHVKESRLDPRAKKALFMGITSRINGYRLWCLEAKKMIFSRDVTFNESSMLKKVNTYQLDGTSKKMEFERLIVLADRETDDNSPMPKRNTKRPARLNDTVACASSIATDDVPTTYSEAVRDSEKEKKRITMSEEMQSLQKNQTWELSSLPEGKKAIECKWVCAKKEGFPDQDDVRYKARLVAKGYAQKEGIDYNKVLSPVVKHSSTRILLALVAQLDLELVQMDVKTAFLHGDLKEEIYMVQQEGFKVARKEHEVYKIEKLKTRLKSEFEMKGLDEAKMILGMEIVREKKLRKLCLTQKQYFEKGSKSAYMEKVPYANVIGSLMYAMICITLLNDIGKMLNGYTTSEDLLQAMFFTLAKAPISWKSTLQSTIALSTTEVEYMVMTEAVKEAIWLQGLLGELEIKQKFVRMHSYSQRVIHLAKNQVYHARMKHIDVRDQVQLLFGLDRYCESMKIGLETLPIFVDIEMEMSCNEFNDETLKESELDIETGLIMDTIKYPHGENALNVKCTNLYNCNVTVTADLVSEVFACVRNDWEAAFMFFKWVGEHREYAHSLRQYNCLIAILGKMGQFEKCWCLIDEMEKGGKDGGESMVTIQTLLIRYAAVHDVENVVKTFYGYERFGFKVCVDVFHDVLSALCRYKNVNEAEKLMLSNEKVFPLCTKSFNIVLNGWCNVVCSPREAKRVTEGYIVMLCQFFTDFLYDYLY